MLEPISRAASVTTTATRLAAPNTELHQGERGPAVHQLQRCLVKLGHMTRAELSTGPGIFGPRTLDAMQEFQRKHDLPVTGRFTPALRDVMNAALRRADEAPTPTPTPTPSGPSINIAGYGKLSWAKATALVKEVGGRVNPGGQPTVLALRTANSATSQYRDFFVVLKPGGQMKAFQATTRPTSAGTDRAMLAEGMYSLVPRWRDGKFNNDAFIVRTAKGSMTVPVARDRNGDGFYSVSERRNLSSSSEIRVHRGFTSSTSSTGCLNVKDYDAFLRAIGGRDARYNLAVVDA
ncbi:MAG: peptidoglycan-binding protein [Myxococcaceae bacterium]|nr:peptidoglycan-binding protein [Myxococcaceae bacterium]